MPTKPKAKKPSSVNTRQLGKDDRPEDDNYPSPPEIIRALVDVQEFPEGSFWDCFAGQGFLKFAVEECGHDCIGTTLHDYGESLVIAGRDFEIEPKALAPKIISNPPFFLIEATKGRIILRMFEIGAETVSLFLPITFLLGERRYENLFKELPPTMVWMLSNRITLIPHRLWRGPKDPEFKNPGSISYAWFHWDKNSGKQRGQFDWIDTSKYRREDDGYYGG